MKIRPAVLVDLDDIQKPAILEEESQSRVGWHPCPTTNARCVSLFGGFPSETQEQGPSSSECAWSWSSSASTRPKNVMPSSHRCAPAAEAGVLGDDAGETDGPMQQEQDKGAGGSSLSLFPAPSPSPSPQHPYSSREPPACPTTSTTSSSNLNSSSTTTPVDDDEASLPIVGAPRLVQTTTRQLQQNRHHQRQSRTTDATSIATATMNTSSASLSSSASAASAAAPSQRAQTRRNRRPSPLDLPSTSSSKRRCLNDSRRSSSSNLSSPKTVIKQEYDIEDAVDSHSHDLEHAQELSLLDSSAGYSLLLPGSGASDLTFQTTASTSGSSFAISPTHASASSSSSFSSSSRRREDDAAKASTCQSNTGSGFYSTAPARATSPASSIDLRSTSAPEDSASELDNDIKPFTNYSEPKQAYQENHHQAASSPNCGCFEDTNNSSAQIQTLPPRIRVPVHLPRPESVRKMDISNLILDESLAGVPVQYIRDSIISQGPELLSSVIGSSVGLPTAHPQATASTSTSFYSSSSPSDPNCPAEERSYNGMKIPHSIAIRTPARVVHSTPALPEYALAVTSDENKQVMLLPVHGLVLAFNCQSFAQLSTPPSENAPEYSASPTSRACYTTSTTRDLHVEHQQSEMQQQQHQEYEHEQPDTVRILPVVHIHLPSATAFSKLMPFFYTHERSSLLSALLPLHMLPPVHPDNNNNSTAIPPNVERTPAMLAGYLAQLDHSILVHYIHVNHATWKTAVALGAAGDDLWNTMAFAWAALIGAMSMQVART